MKVYVYDYVPDLTDNWHSGGGAVVVTDSRRPLGVLRKATGRSCNGASRPVVYDTDATEERVFVFPDAGCC